MDQYVTKEEFQTQLNILQEQINKSNIALQGSDKAVRNSQDAVYQSTVVFPKSVKHLIETFNGTMRGNVTLTGNVQFPPYQGNPYIFPDVMVRSPNTDFINDSSTQLFYSSLNIVDPNSLGYVTANNGYIILSPGTYNINILTNVLNDVLVDKYLTISLYNQGNLLYDITLTSDNYRQWNSGIALNDLTFNIPVSSNIEIRYYLNASTGISHEDLKFYMFIKKVSDGFLAIDV